MGLDGLLGWCTNLDGDAINSLARAAASTVAIIWAKVRHLPLLGTLRWHSPLDGDGDHRHEVRWQANDGARHGDGGEKGIQIFNSGPAEPAWKSPSYYWLAPFVLTGREPRRAGRGGRQAEDDGDMAMPLFWLQVASPATTNPDRRPALTARSV
ncbi:hypothetical protein CDD83_9079 [Cordyceps sp. RAO-2017]|nr:hypothetical protein CDD83_9079 [Cordyceps sp. RAO-2017]